MSYTKEQFTFTHQFAYFMSEKYGLKLHYIQEFYVIPHLSIIHLACSEGVSFTELEKLIADS